MRAANLLVLLLATAWSSAPAPAFGARPPAGATGRDRGDGGHRLSDIILSKGRAPSDAWQDAPRSGAGGAWSWLASGLKRLIGGSHGGEEECETGDIRKNGLKAIREIPLIGLFEDLKDVTKFEASGMTTARDHLWIVFDNLHSIGRVEEHFQFRSPNNILLGPLGDDSQFEGLSYDDHTGHFYVVEEVVEMNDTHLHPYAQEIAVDERRRGYTVIERCPINFLLSHKNKGFEGIHYWRDPKDSSREYLMGLCEGNYCKGGRRGRESGNGRIVLSTFWKNSSGCGWDVVKVVTIPPSANFQDYSGIDVRGNKVAITSQEDSTLWIGTFDFDALDFVNPEDDQVYYFPRDNHCDMIYCNVEGIAWLDDYRFIVASDKAKSYQPYRCTPHDQSIGIFALPN